MSARDRLCIRRSSISGFGLFARDLIGRGSLIGVYRGVRWRTGDWNAFAMGYGAIWGLSLDDELVIDGSLPGNILRFANHSCEPNAEFVLDSDQIRLCSLRSIFAGQEILADYGYSLGEGLGHRCRCGSSRCVGRILHRDLHARYRARFQRRPGRSLLRR